MTNAPTALSGSNYLAEMLNDHSIDRVMAIDVNWNIVAWNNTAATVTGINKKDILGKHLLDVFPKLQDDEEMMHAIFAAMNGMKSFVPSHQSLFNRQYYENHFIPLLNEEEQVIGVMNIMHDVAHRIKVEQQLIKLNKALEKKYQQLERVSSEMATFTYITSNNIKEPLKYIYTSMELLIRAEGQLLSNGGKANLRRMQGSLNRMNLLLDDILSLSSINNFKEGIELVNLQNVLQEVLEPLKQKIAEREVVIETGELPAVQGFKKMLHYLFLNLIDNAIKFQAKENKPLIQIKSSRVTVEGKNYIQLSFTDNGIGFEQKNAERIFVMFEKLHARNQYRGSGAGLAVCKKIMEEHDGIIRAESTPGAGSTFYCLFPNAK